MKFIILLLFCMFSTVFSEQDECYGASTCGGCIRNVNCVWCADEDMKKGARRCMPHNDVKVKNWCQKKIDPELQIDIPSNKPFNDSVGATVQLKPQEMIVKARPGVKVPINISYKPAKDYPLDVYYLMDISATMKQAKDDLQAQATVIYNQLTNYTNNVMLGIGSFVEKPGYPYVDLFKKDKHMSYAFKNHLSITDNVTQFKQTIDSISFGANYDDPEAGLDALMQVMKCEKELGWRKDSRRIIVLCTDSTYHSAGDGKALAVIKPNDMQCHLDRNGQYSDDLALTYDYPSVSQINRVAEQGHFIIIFAAREAVKLDYTELARHIVGAKYAVLKDGKDVVEIIKKAYLEREATVKLTYNLPPFIQLTLDQSCETKPTKNCESTPDQRTVNIPGNLSIQYCPPDNKMVHDIVIKTVGINDKLTIRLEAICKCDCETNTGDEVLTPKCSNAGYLKCGICHCIPNRSGDDCLCNTTSTTNTDNTETCKMLEEDRHVCSGKGTCICGKCKCNDEFSGEFCQYGPDSCPNKCFMNGICYLGKCQCDKDWIGVDCSCTMKTDTCIAPHSKKFCSGNGECKCGHCECHKQAANNETYFGRYCDGCADCTEKRCKELEKYVVCNVINEKAFCDTENKVTGTIVEFLNKTELNAPEWYMAKLCKTRLDNDSYIIFKYQYDDGKLKLGIQNEAELPPKANIFIAVGSAIGTVLIIGILTLIIWKILVDLHDKREYQKFYKESQAAGFDVTLNPLYDRPETNFTNPTYEHN